MHILKKLFEQSQSIRKLLLEFLKFRELFKVSSRLGLTLKVQGVIFFKICSKTCICKNYKDSAK